MEKLYRWVGLLANMKRNGFKVGCFACSCHCCVTTTSVYTDVYHFRQVKYNTKNKTEVDFSYNDN